ncbi:MAG: hypothetical protein CMM76_02325 [Rhodospirillaceae bacterium]|nr:hypothetical protein [Rhodospirillaceae bacterium]
MSEGDVKRETADTSLAGKKIICTSAAVAAVWSGTRIMKSTRVFLLVRFVAPGFQWLGHNERYW